KPARYELAALDASVTRDVGADFGERTRVLARGKHVVRQIAVACALHTALRERGQALERVADVQPAVRALGQQGELRGAATLEAPALHDRSRHVEIEQVLRHQHELM